MTDFRYKIQAVLTLVLKHIDTAGGLGRAFWVSIVATFCATQAVAFIVSFLPLSDIFLFVAVAPASVLAGLLAYRAVGPYTSFTLGRSVLHCALAFACSLIYALSTFSGFSGLFFGVLFAFFAYAIKIVMGVLALQFWERKFAVPEE
jgi:hypothetical protein